MQLLKLQIFIIMLKMTSQKKYTSPENNVLLLLYKHNISLMV